MEISLPISLGVFISIIAILIAVLVLFIVLFTFAVLRKNKTSERVVQLQSRVTELSAVYEELDPRASILLHNSDNDMETMDNKAYSVPRKATPKIDLAAPQGETPKVDLTAPPGEAYEIMRSVSHQ